MARRLRHSRRSLTAVGVATGFILVVGGLGVAVGNGPTSAGSTSDHGDRLDAATTDVLLDRASERLIGRCMARHGFTYAEQPPPTKPGVPDVLNDVGWAREHGYGPLFGERRPGDQDPNVGILQKLTRERQGAWNRTLMGAGRQLVVDLPGLGRLSTPDNGCIAEARRTLYGDLAGWYRARRTVDHLSTYVGQKVSTTPAYRTGLAAWARCVHKRGYAASTPAELRHLVAPASTEPAGERARRREIAAAVSEAACGASTGFSRTSAGLERKYRPEIERRFERELHALKVFERKAIPRARRALADA